MRRLVTSLATTLKENDMIASLKVYRFKVKYAPFTLPSMRVIVADSYTNALNELYFPTDNRPQPIEADLIDLEVNGVHKGADSLKVPGNFDQF